MIAAQNGAYMRLFSENLKLSASFATLEYVVLFFDTIVRSLISSRKAYQTLASGASRQPSASTVDAIDTVTLTPENYPAVRFWYKEDMKDERAKRRIEDKKNGRRGLLFKRKNVNFWFLQNVDGTPVHNSTVSSLRAEAKLIWSGMCEDYGPMGLLWSSVPVKRRMEFWLKLENKYPLLRLCANHYKANSVASEDYTHWHKTRYPNRDGALDSGSTSRKRRRAALPVHARKSQRRGSRSRRVSMLRIEDDDEDDEAVEEVRVGRESNDYEEDDDGDNEVHEGDGEDHEGDDEVHDDESEDRDGDESEDRALVESEDRDSNKFEDHVDEEHDNDGDEVDDGSSNGEDEDEGVNNNLKVIPDPESDATPSTRPKPSEQKLSSLMRGPSNTRVISDVNGDATVCLVSIRLPPYSR